MPAEVDPRCDGSENSGHVKAFRRKIGHERGQQRDRDLNGRIVEMAVNPADHVADEEAEANSAERDADKTN